MKLTVAVEGAISYSSLLPHFSYVLTKLDHLKFPDGVVPIDDTGAVAYLNSQRDAESPYLQFDSDSLHIDVRLLNQGESLDVRVTSQYIEGCIHITLEYGRGDKDITPALLWSHIVEASRKVEQSAPGVGVFHR